MSEPNMRQPGALGQVFGSTPGAAGLAGKLPRRGEQQPTSTAAAVPAPVSAPPAGPAVDVDQGQAVEQTQPTAAARTSTAPASADLAPEPTYQVSVYVLPDIVRAAEQVRRRSRRTNAEIAYAALDAVRERLGELVAERRLGPAPAADSMFPARRTRNQRAAAAQDGRRQLWSIQATEGELAVLDGLVERHGARSRSELISVAVEAHLGRKRARSR
ncbi:hypothetical protein [Microbispora sp. CA-102843]|uniref:hypothetical protein n=1 Tax=Microbispora sp. CA-102843 TaxID=3239952 RepID=UPI003D8A3FA1